jgi:hypothetical protein
MTQVLTFQLSTGSQIRFTRSHGLLCVCLFQDGEASPWAAVTPDGQDELETVWAGQGLEEYYNKGDFRGDEIAFSVCRGEMLDGQLQSSLVGSLLGFSIQVNGTGGWRITIDRGTVGSEMYRVFKLNDVIEDGQPRMRPAHITLH